MLRLSLSGRRAMGCTAAFSADAGGKAMISTNRLTARGKRRVALPAGEPDTMVLR